MEYAVNVDLLKGQQGSKRQGEYLLIRCPFHNDHNPSCSVKMTAPYKGVFRCFSCGSKGGFRKLAEKLGLDVNAEATPRLDAEAYADMFQMDSLQDDEDVRATYPLSDKNARTLGIEKGWRGFSLDFLREVIGALVVDSRTLYFPVMVNGKEEGYIRAFVSKRDGYPSYLNKRGTWSRDKGLFLFDQARSRSPNTVILTEGPRDAARLMRDANLPAVAILGTNSWSEGKLRKLVLSGVTEIIICMDGDEAGKNASETIKDSIEGYCGVHDFKLWEWEGEYDPCNMPDKLLNKLVKLYRKVSSLRNETA